MKNAFVFVFSCHNFVIKMTLDYRELHGLITCGVKTSFNLFRALIVCDILMTILFMCEFQLRCLQITISRKLQIPKSAISGS